MSTRKQHIIDEVIYEEIDEEDDNDYFFRKNNLLEQITKLKKYNYIDKSIPYMYFILISSINNNFEKYVKIGIVDNDIERGLLNIFNTFCPMEYITILFLIKIDNPRKYKKIFNDENKNIKLTNIYSGNFDKKSKECYPYQIGCNKFISYYINHIKPNITNIENNVYFNNNDQYVDHYFKQFNKSKNITMHIIACNEINDVLYEETFNYINKLSIGMKCKIYIEINKHFNWVGCKIIDISNVRKSIDIKIIRVILDDKTIKYNDIKFNVENTTYGIMWKII